MATRTERRRFAQVDFRREMRLIAFVDPGAFVGTYRSAFLQGCDYFRIGRGTSTDMLTHELDWGRRLTQFVRSLVVWPEL